MHCEFFGSASQEKDCASQEKDCGLTMFTPAY
jgi:hypothetical protein